MSFNLIEKNMIAYSKIELFPKLNFYFIHKDFNRFDKISKKDNIVSYGSFGGLKSYNSVLRDNRLYNVDNLVIENEAGILPTARDQFNILKSYEIEGGTLDQFYSIHQNYINDNESSLIFTDTFDDFKDYFAYYNRLNSGFFNPRNNYVFNTKILSNKFIINNPEFRKKLCYDTSIKFYKENLKHDNYHKLEKGFSNYNTINFFNINEGNIESENRYTNFETNKTHKNVIVYPNLKNELGISNYDFNETKDNSFTFYINARRKNIKDFHYNPGCIIDIPGVICIYLVKGSSIDNDGFTDGFRLALQIGEETLENFSNSFESFDITNSQMQTNYRTILSSDNILKYNYWHSVCINYTNISSNKSIIEIFIDGVLKDSSTSIVKMPKESHSYISIGNKYETSTKDFDDLVYKLFSRHQKENNDNEGAYVNKHILLGDQIESVFDRVPNESISHDLKNNLKQSNIEYCDELTSLALNSELHDIRIFNLALDKNQIQNICKKGVENFKEDIQNGLIFYVPVYYKSQYVKKKGLINLSAPYQKYFSIYDYPNADLKDQSTFFVEVDEYLQGEYTEVSGSYQIPEGIVSEPEFSVQTQNICYNFPVNPFFLNFTGGTDVSVEHYLREFIKNTQPNIVIGNNIIEDKYANCFLTTTSTVLHDKYFNYISKSGKTPHEIFDFIANKENYDVKKINSMNIKYQENNILYRNYMILPNDNGIQNQYYSEDIFNYNINDFVASHKNSLQYEDLSYVSLENIDDSFRRKNSLTIRKLNIKDYISEDITIDRESREDFVITNSPYYNFSPYRGENSGLGLSNRRFIFKSRLNKLENISLSNYFNEYNTSYIHEQNSSLVENASAWLQSDEPYYFFKEDLHSNTGFYKTFSNPSQRSYYSSYEHTISQKEVYDYKILDSENQISYKKMIMPLWESNNNILENHSKYIIVPRQQFDKYLVREKVHISDLSLGKISGLQMSFKDTRLGTLYRADCFTEHAKWASFGSVLYNEGLSFLMHPSIFEFGKSNFNFKAECGHSLNVFEINLPAHASETNQSRNTSYIENLRLDNSAFNFDENFVYITNIDLHDENLNIIAKAKLATPFAKKDSDNVLFRLKMDY